jgi:glyceraldehyde 3-phosphate dehydrogenase
MKRIAINGFGRIGRLTLRYLLKQADVEIVAINDLTDNKTLAHLFKYDSAHGVFPGEVGHTDAHIIIDGKKIVASAIRNPLELPWKELKVDIVLECTGVFRTMQQLKWHLEAGAKKVLLSAPAKDAEVKTVVLGVNDDTIKDSDTVLSNASCTTNCLAPIVKVINDNWGFVQGAMTTTHAYTGDQNIQDSPHSDLRRARAAAFSIIPTSTGAAKAVGKVIPDVLGKISALAMRVPTITGSLVELNCIIDKDATVEEVNAKFKEASEKHMKGILQYCEDPIVSADIISNAYSSIYDAELTQVNGKMLKVISWYDNEMGYATRLGDLAMRV